MEVKSQYINLLVGLSGLIIGVIIYFLIIPATIVIPEGVKVNEHVSIDFIPKLWTILWIISSLGLLIQSLILIPKKEYYGMIELAIFKIKEIKGPVFSLAAYILLLVIYILTLPYMGFILNSIILLIISVYWFGYRGLIKISSFSIIFTFVCYAFFVYILNADLRF